MLSCSCNGHRSPTSPSVAQSLPHKQVEGIRQPVTDKSQFVFKGRIRSFAQAINGVGIIVRSQHNAWIHTAATIFVAVAGFAFDVSAGEWCWLILAIVIVWVAEAINTAFELLCDVVSPEINAGVKRAKDVAAGAVLIGAIGSTLIGLIVLGPYFGKALLHP